MPKVSRVSLGDRSLPRITRRGALGLIGGGFCAAALPALANQPVAGLPPPGRKALHYQIRYAGAPIGKQSLTFHQRQGSLWIDSRTIMKIGLGPLTAFQFTQESRELWEGGRLVHLHAMTDDDGKRSAFSGIAIEDGFAVTLREGTVVYPADIFTSNDAWSDDALRAPHVIDARDGELLPQKVENLGSDEIEIEGRVMKARRYAVQGKKLEAQLWYDESLLIKADVTRDSDTVEYRLRTGKAPGPLTTGTAKRGPS